ncbi:hypothetical protein LGQ02_06880 [Bacillus shivajii]|uniref:hypothetical protein n=1 Tax=Bacillus shivajii TaxID=1983719 RepID=UPI001CFB01AF|nr:hypothetical protein [Bacillus shivajii]UCZ54481.1 hypothetical protein LGQ02_06880 [Bacillus shivajii]
MVEIFTRGVMLSTLLMLGFILGILYSNHVTHEPSSLLSFIDNKDNQKETEQEIESDPEPSLFDGLKKKDENDLKIDMEDGDHLVVYGQDDEEIKKDLITDVDIQRDLEDKNIGREENSRNFFSEMGNRTADIVHGVFKGIFSIIG